MWGRVLLAKVALFFIFAIAFFVLIWINLLIVDRLAPKVRPPGPEEEMLGRYHAMVSSRARLVRLGVSVCSRCWPRRACRTSGRSGCSS